MVYFLDAKGVMPFIDGFELDLHKCGYELQCLLILLTLHGTMHLKVTVRIKFQRKVFCVSESTTFTGNEIQEKLGTNLYLKFLN